MEGLLVCQGLPVQIWWLLKRIVMRSDCREIGTFWGCQVGINSLIIICVPQYVEIHHRSQAYCTNLLLLLKDHIQRHINTFCRRERSNFQCAYLVVQRDQLPFSRHQPMNPRTLGCNYVFLTPLFLFSLMFHFIFFISLVLLLIVHKC